MERRILMKVLSPREELVSAWQILESVKTKQPSEHANPVGTITRVLMFRCHCMAAVVTGADHG